MVATSSCMQDLQQMVNLINNKSGFFIMSPSIPSTKYYYPLNSDQVVQFKSNLKHFCDVLPLPVAR